jgi:hypothetical protein
MVKVKVLDGEVRLIQALISATGHGTTGWERRAPRGQSRDHS